MKLASFFTGIAGFDLGFDQAGIETAFQCEIDKNCLKLLEARFPHARRITDITDERQVQSHADLIADCPVWCGGFPCQDLSVAGARAGLAGERSGLWFAFRALIADFRPPLVVIENVPGLLSSETGRDFTILLRGLEELGYGVAWRVLDAQYFGLAQRRERVFIVASLGSLRCAQILFEPESLCRDTAPSREAGEGFTHDIAPCIGAGGRGFERAGETRGQDPVVAFGGNNTSGQIDIATACNAHGGTGRHDFESETFVTGASPAMDTNLGSGGQTHSRQIAERSGVRRLTPLECERLQGFPDNWTAGFSDSTRYRMIGNAVAVPVARWVGTRIVSAHPAASGKINTRG